MKRFLQISLPTFLLLMAVGTEAFAWAQCAAVCIPVSRRRIDGERYYFARNGFSQTMSETGRDRERALEKLKDRCDDDDEVLIVGPVSAFGPYGSLIFMKATESNACTGSWGALEQGPKSVVPAKFDVAPETKDEGRGTHGG